MRYLHNKIESNIKFKIMTFKKIKLIEQFIKRLIFNN